MLFADDTSIVIANANVQEYKHNVKITIQEINDWFCSNSLTINYNNYSLLTIFYKKNKKEIPFQIITTNTVLTNMNSMIFLGLTIDSTMLWKEHIISLAIKINKASFTIRGIKPLLNLNALKTIYYTYFHSVMSYGIIFWETSHFATNIFRIQKRMIRTITNRSKRDSCGLIFKQLQILTLPGQYVYSLLMFVNKSRECFYLILTFMVGIRVNLNLRLPTTNLKLVQKGVYHSAIKIFNHLPTEIKSLFEDPKHFKIEVRSFLLDHTLYSLDDYYRLTPNETYTNTS